MWKALSSVLCPLFPAMYLCHFFICINLRQPIFKIHVKILVPEIYSPSRGEDSTASARYSSCRRTCLSRMPQHKWRSQGNIFLPISYCTNYILAYLLVTSKIYKPLVWFAGAELQFSATNGQSGATSRSPTPPRMSQPPREEGDRIRLRQV